ncbi:MAG: response regulator transcription factor, partial [Bdellovibrionales bacterium]|nr:response regulator transcription factor [Bdellovibrionales bacterium]
MSEPSSGGEVDKVDAALLEAASNLLRAKERGVLLVEDTAAHAAIIRRVLEQDNWIVRHETRASTAIEAFEADPSSI